MTVQFGSVVYTSVVCRSDPCLGENSEPPKRKNIYYTELCLPLTNTQASFCGLVSATPVPTGENKVFSISISAYLTKKGGVNVFSDFTIHCLMAGTPSLGEHLLS
jgi:hypothetical protein